MSGESYAGHYIPSMVDYFTVLNRGVLPEGDFVLPVKGLAIGNGWSIPRVQYNYGEYAHNIGIISGAAAAMLTGQYNRCKAQESAQDYSGQGSCNILGEIMAASGPCPAQREVAADDDGSPTPSNNSKNFCYGPIMNYYDTRLYYDAMSDWPDGDVISVFYLNSPQLKQAIHARKKIDYQECSAAAGKYLAILDGLGVEQEIIRILEQGIPITFYNGQYDLICNHMGNDAMLHQLKWSGSRDFKHAQQYVWTLPELAADGKTVRQIPAGYTRHTPDQRLTFIVVIGASHMVPYDVPKASLDLIRRVIHNQTFGDYRQDLSWTFTDDSIDDIKEETKTLLHSIYIFFIQGPYAVDYSLIFLCTIFIMSAACYSRGCCWRSHSNQYTRIPTSLGKQSKGSASDSSS